MHILLHAYKSGCQRKTFLCAVATQMFHKVVPTQTEVRAQSAYPLKYLSSPWPGDGKNQGKQAIFFKRCPWYLPLPYGIFLSTTRGWGPRKLGPTPRLLLCSPGDEGCGLSRPLFPCLYLVLNELIIYAQCPEQCLTEWQLHFPGLPYLGSGQKPVASSWSLLSCALGNTWAGGQDLTRCQARRQWSDSL